MDCNICQRPFSEIEIDVDGEVRTCCPDYINYYSIGNIFKVSSFDDIWYSEKAIELRKKILNSDFSLCNTKICSKKINQEDIQLIEKPLYPTLVRYAYDEQCNLKCMFCRDSIKLNTTHQNDFFDERIDTLFLPILKNAKILSLTSAGEVTVSKHTQKIIKRAAEKYPNLKFELLTNGLLFNEKFCEELGINEKIEKVAVSLHAMKKETYETIMRGSNYEIVHKNIAWLSSLKKEGKINGLGFIFVVNSLNYKEIPAFIKYSLEKDAYPSVWEYRNLNRTQMDKTFKKYAVWDKEHPYYNDFVKIINKVQKDYSMVALPEIFQNLKPVSFTTSLINKIKNINL